MGWAFCGTDSRGREIGYGIEATCDEPGCTAEIDRGLAYACGAMHGRDDEKGTCEGYFCEAHLVWMADIIRCSSCASQWEQEHPEDDQ